MANRIKMGPENKMIGDMEVAEFQMKPIVPNSANDPMMEMAQQKRKQMGMMPALGVPMDTYKDDY
tara:strand:+ start:626 stop:820 length:195 start_codon:yes stop_codon:yes gene_type:complete